MIRAGVEFEGMRVPEMDEPGGWGVAERRDE